jgi:hypothetical protein
VPMIPQLTESATSTHFLALERLDVLDAVA